MSSAAIVPTLTGESGYSRYFEQIRRFPMPERQEEYMLAKRWCEHGDRDGYTHYFEEIRRFPMLEPQDELTLGKRWREHGDLDAAHKLVTSHLRLVGKIAMGYRGYGMPISEVISEGNIGLMQAVERFEPSKGFRLATYARWWIKAAIQEYILPLDTYESANVVITNLPSACRSAMAALISVRGVVILRRRAGRKRRCKRNLRPRQAQEPWLCSWSASQGA